MSVPTVFIWQSSEERLGIRSGFARTRGVRLTSGRRNLSPIYEVGALILRDCATVRTSKFASTGRENRFRGNCAVVSDRGRRGVAS